VWVGRSEGGAAGKKKKLVQLIKRLRLSFRRRGAEGCNQSHNEWRVEGRNHEAEKNEPGLTSPTW